MMNCNKQYTIKVTEGNAFGLLLQLKSRTFQSSVPIDEDIDATHLEDIVIKVNNEAFTDFTADESGVLMNIPADMAVGTYNVELTGSYYDVEIRAGYFQCFSIVPWSYQSDAVNYIPGSPIATEAAYVVVGIIDDQELEDLKAELRLKIAAAEAAKEAADQAKEDFDEKAENLDNLDNVAQQGTNENATLTNTQAAAIAANQYGQTINNKIGEPQSGQADTLFGAIANINIDTSTIAQRTDVKDGNDTAISVAKEIRSEVGTGSDTAAESGTLFAVVKWVKDKVKSIFNLIGSPTSGQPSDLFAAIAAGGGGGGDAQESTSQAILAAVNQMVNSHIVSRYALDAFTFGTIQNPTELDIYLNKDDIIGINCGGPIQTANTAFYHNHNLRFIRLTNTQKIAQSTFYEMNNLEEVELPNATETSAGLVALCPKVTRVYVPKLHIINSYRFLDSDTKLIDLTIGELFDRDVTMTMNFTEAWDDTTNTLVNSGEPFDNNNEKWNYNLRQNFAGLLPDRTGQTAYTITVGATALSKMEQATINAFTAKNWTLA